MSTHVEIVTDQLDRTLQFYSVLGFTVKISELVELWAAGAGPPFRLGRDYQGGQ